MKIITISVAAYNVEKYLERTLNSLICEEVLNQIEVLIIDDGSKDGTSVIAKKITEKYPETFKYINKENGGHGSTINKGIELATGKYFRVLDGDDYVNTNEFVKFIHFLEHSQADMVISNYLWVDDKGNSRKHNHKEFLKLNHGVSYNFAQKFDASLFGLSTISIKTELLKSAGVKIKEKCFYVDVEFVVWCIYLSDNFSFCNYDVYMYRCLGTTDNSINKDNMLRNVKMQEMVVVDLIDFYEENVKTQNYRTKKEEMILQRIKQSIMATVRCYLLMKDKNKRKKCIKKFDYFIRKKSINIYNDLRHDKIMRIVRIYDYKFISLIAFLYEFYLCLKQRLVKQK